MPGMAILAGERHRRVDGGVARGPEYEDLRGGGDQDRLELAAAGRQAARHPLGERLTDQPVAAHGGRGDGPHEAAGRSDPSAWKAGSAASRSDARPAPCGA